MRSSLFGTFGGTLDRPPGGSEGRGWEDAWRRECSRTLSQRSQDSQLDHRAHGQFSHARQSPRSALHGTLPIRNVPRVQGRWLGRTPSAPIPAKQSVPLVRGGELGFSHHAPNGEVLELCLHGAQLPLAISPARRPSWPPRTSMAAELVFAQARRFSGAQALCNQRIRRARLRSEFPLLLRRVDTSSNSLRTLRGSARRPRPDEARSTTRSAPPYRLRGNSRGCR